MDISMAIPASRFDIKPMFFVITKIMMVLLCLVWTISAFVKRCARKFSYCDSIIYGTCGLYLTSMLSFPRLEVFTSKLLSFFALAILFLRYLIIFASSINKEVFFTALRFTKSILRFFCANFTFKGYSIFSGTVFIKLTERLSSFTGRAIFFFFHRSIISRRNNFVQRNLA